MAGNAQAVPASSRECGGGPGEWKGRKGAGGEGRSTEVYKVPHAGEEDQK